jgi:hypothetical protein
MFTLERLIDSAELLRNAGFDAYAYRGRHKTRSRVRYNTTLVSLAAPASAAS